MKCVIPEISYHNVTPVLSLDFQPVCAPGEPLRLATAGADFHVVIFSVTSSEPVLLDEEGSAAVGGEEEGGEGGGSVVNLECLCDLTRHQKSVNIVRWSPNGKLLASGDDESIIILWQMKEGGQESAPRLFDEDGPENRENWVVYKIIRSHLDDVYDLAWSPCSQFLLSGSVDNSAIVTNVHKNQKVAHFSESKSFVQGVAWNPKHPVLATLSSDRKCRFYNFTTKKMISSTYKALLNMPDNLLVKDKKDKKDKKESSKTENKTETTESKSDEATSKIQEKSENLEKSNSGDQKKCDDKQEKMDTDEKKSEEKKKDEKCEVRLFHDDTFKGFFRRLTWSMDGELLVMPSGVLDTASQAKVTHCTYVFTRLDLNRPALCLPSRDKFTVAAKFCPQLFKLREVKRKGVTVTEGMAPWEKYQTVFALPYRMVYAVATANAVMVYDTQQASPIARVSNIHYVGLSDISWSPDGTILMVSSIDGFCSIITFAPGELGQLYSPEQKSDPENQVNPQESNLEANQKPSSDGAQKPEQESAEKKSPQGQGFNEHGVKSPAQVHIKSNKEGGKSNPKRLKFITLKSPKPKALLSTTGGAIDVHDENGVDVDTFNNEEATNLIEGVVPMEDDDTLNLQLEETQPSAPTPPVADKKRVPLISVPNGASNDTNPAPAEEEAKQPAAPKKRVELITIHKSTKPLSQ